MKNYGIVIVDTGGDRRLFASIRRADPGDVYVNWVVDEVSPSPRVPKWNPHGSYHASGQLHSKSYNRIAIRKHRRTPGPAFTGSEPLEVTNADRALSASLPADPGGFDDYFEIDVSLITGSPAQAIAVDLIAPDAEPVRLTGSDTVIAEKVFKDQIPWISVSLVEPPLPKL